MGAAVVAAPAADEPGAAGDAFGQLHCGLDRLGAAVHEVHGVQRGRQQAGEAFREAHLRLLDELTVRDHVQVAVALGLDRLHDPGMPVAHVGDGQAGHQVEVAPTVPRGEVAALGMDDVQGEGMRARLGEVVVERAVQVLHGRRGCRRKGARSALNGVEGAGRGVRPGARACGAAVRG